MKVLVIGAAGQLGTDVVTTLHGHEIDAPSHDRLDVADENSVASYVEQAQPDAVINTSAYHNVPLCEERPEEAFRINAVGVRHLARACRKQNAKLVHVSTDYVFDGKKGAPYDEGDEARPLMVYGASKLAGEHLALAEWEQGTYIARTTGLFGKNPCRAKPGGRNFVETMLHLAATRDEVKVVDDQRCCPTYTPDLARQLAALIEGDVEPGIYHCVTPEGGSWYDFARLIFETAKVDVRLTPTKSDAFPSPVRRPADSRLSTKKLEDAGIFRMRPLHEAIRVYLGTS